MKGVIIERVRLGTTARDFRKMFPEIELTKPDPSDYDPGLWKSVIRFNEFASASETIEGVRFDISISFAKESLTFLQYFGRTGNDGSGYAAGLRAFKFLSKAMETSLGPPTSSTSPKTYEAFAEEPRSSSGMPDDRWVEGASAAWAAGWIHLSENAYGALILELRMGA